MLIPGRIPLTEREHKAVEKLLATHEGNATITRRDPGETGPVLVHLGDATYQISANGRTKKVN